MAGKLPLCGEQAGLSQSREEAKQVAL